MAAPTLYRLMVALWRMARPLMLLIVALWRMARPLMLLSVLLVYALGCLMAQARGYTGSLSGALWAGLALLLVSLSIHYVNEYADYPSDMLTQRTAFSGGSGVLPQGIITPRTALRAAWATLLLGMVVAIVGVLWNLLDGLTLPVLMLGTWGGWMYSMPPLRLVWRGWGEATNALLGGMLLAVYGYVVIAGRLDLFAVLAMLPFALADFLNLLATTWADVEADRRVGKRTLATRFHVGWLRLLYAGVALLILILLLTLPEEILPAPVALGSLLVMPLTLWGWLQYTRTPSPTPSVVAMVSLLLMQIVVYFLLSMTS